MENLNLLFHKIYYDKIGTDEFKQKVEDSNKKIFGATFVHADDFLQCDILNVKTLHMKTQYPGLLIGTGYPHGSGLADDDIKCGFSFDYVSGQPYIPGSSVKGVLRSHFKDHRDAVAEIADIPEETVTKLEKNIFDYGDTFLDAVLYDGDSKNRILGEEYITPHSECTKTPVPIHIMKILPDVRFEFRFVVSDYKEGEFTFTGEQKKNLFRTLLELFGIGAKTNVGYGILKSDDSAPRARASQRTAQQNDAVPSIQSHTSQSHANQSPANVQSQANTNPSDVSDSEKIKCPHCGSKNYRYDKNGNVNLWCYKFECQKALDGSDAVNPNPKIKCPHCDTPNYTYDLQGKKNTKCFNRNCRKPLY